MNTLLKVATLVAIATAPLNAIAQPVPGALQHIFQNPAELLGLSVEQEQQIAALRSAAHAETETDRARMEELQGLLHNLEGEFDAGTAQTIADEIGQITARLVYSRAATAVAINALLTPQQQVLLQELRESMPRRHGGDSRRRRASPEATGF